jgi:hypothetical protein
VNYSEMASFVRSQADTDSTDAPDATLQVYARAAYVDIQNRVFPWPDKKVSATFATVVNQAAYPLTGLTPGTIEYVVSVATSDDPLIYVSDEQRIELQTGSQNSGSPTCYTVNQDGIVLWPKPSAVETITVTGYRQFTTWALGATEPDLARAFDEPICWYMLARFYQAQEDLELSARYMQDFEVGVNRQIESALRGSSVTAGPMIFGGDMRLGRMSYSDWVKKGVEG